MRTAVLGLALLSCASMAGCHIKPPPNPNNFIVNGSPDPTVMKRAIDRAADVAFQRVDKKQITEQEALRLIAEVADSIMKTVNRDSIPPGQTFEYAELFRSAKRWDYAEGLFEKSMNEAKNLDRKVNSAVRLAQCEANLAKDEKAIQTARSVFGVPAEQKAPILPAVLYEIVPPMEKRANKKDLVQLLLDAIKQHEQTIVDPGSPEGRSFIMARPHHIRLAYELALKLARESGDEALAAKVRALAIEFERGEHSSDRHAIGSLQDAEALRNQVK